MPEEGMVKKAGKWKPMLTRPLGRPKNRWEDDIINDMKKRKTKILIFGWLCIIVKLFYY
jgi:hypothetical protein